MTVPAQTPINRSTGNGVTTVFPYTFKIIADADIEVTVDDVVKTLNVDYTVSGAGVDAGGNVTMTVAPANATSVVRRRNMALVRSTDYQDQGELPATTLDNDIDATVLMVQQLDERLDRTFSLPASFSGDSTLPAPEPGYLIGWDATGENLTNIPASVGSSLVDLAAPSGSSLVGYLPAGTGAVSTTVQAKLRESVSNYDYKLAGDVDDTASIQRALAASLNVNIQGNLTVSGTGTLFNIRSGQRITCNATLTHSTTTGVIFSASAVEDWVIDGQLAVYGAGNTNSSQTALYISGCNRYKVYNLLAANIAGWGIKIDPGTYVAPYADSGKFFGCLSYNCYYGLEGTAGTGAEFVEFHGYTSALCTYGTVVSAGNWQFLGGHDVQNVNGFTLLAGANNSHGQCVGRSFSHNSSYNFRSNGATNGWVNVGCNAYGDGLSLGYIWLTNTTGITWIGGNIDSPILLDGTTTYCKFSNCNIPGTYSAITGTRTAFLQIENCYTPTGGVWDKNDPAFCYVLANRASSTQTAAGGATIVFNNATKDNRSAYSDTTGTFTTPATGWYTVSVNLTITGTALAAGYAEIKKNGTTICYVPIVTANAGATIAVASASVDIALTAADTIIVTATAGGTTPLIAVDTSWISISSKG